ncbi:MAG: hypothetical protein H6Q70_4213 [Firmicutes bacterium]|nr:hypothetical protein [Bacillota bacterium]
MKQFEYHVESVLGHCSCGYKAGDIIRSKGMNTPDTQFCGGAYIALFPIQVALFNGARFSFEDNPKSKGKLSCPDNGSVIFRVVMIDE